MEILLERLVKALIENQSRMVIRVIVSDVCRQYTCANSCRYCIVNDFLRLAEELISSEIYVYQDGDSGKWLLCIWGALPSEFNSKEELKKALMNFFKSYIKGTYSPWSSSAVRR